ncbi:unnamed protein product, partial [Mesorhabditis belari]|uniref:Uncharacterized protein n=1 Tax=Mesorhabditis belari TaxID=2138241 RepID=A0AAF3F2R4_9BILA
MEFRIENLPRLAAFSFKDYLFCAKGSYIERYEVENGEVRIGRKFGPIEEKGCEIGQIAGSSTSVNVFFTCGHSLYWLSTLELLTSSNDTNVIPKRAHKQCRIAHIRPFDNQTVMLIYSNSAIDLCSAQDPEGTLKAIPPQKSVQIMGATSDGENFEKCRVLLHTYLGSMMLLMPGREDFPSITYDGSPGMTFDALIAGHLCFSIHDDRSLRVWDLDNQKLNTSIAHEFGHMARPFSLCINERTMTIYTAGNDEKILRWNWDPRTQKLIATGERTMSIGSIRKMVLWKRKLIIASDAGFLLSLDQEAFDFPITAGKISKTITSIRAACSLGNVSFLIDEKGQLLKLTKEDALDISFSDPAFKIRYFASSSGFESQADKMVIAWGEKGIVEAATSTVLYKSTDPSSRLISVIRWDRLLFAATSDDKILWIPVDAHIPSPSPNFIDLRVLRGGISKKNPFIINCAAVFKSGSMNHCLFGCASSQLMLVSFDENFAQSEKIKILEATKLFNGDAVQDLWVEDGHLYALGKCGYMFIWSFDVDSDMAEFHFLQRVYVGIDWPCRFLQTNHQGELKRLIFGFKAKVAILYDLSTQMCVWHSDCGGGNRQWNANVQGDSIQFEHIRNQIRFVTESKIHHPQLLDRTLHIGKVLFCEVIPSENGFHLISAGADNRLVISSYSSENQLIAFHERFEADGFVSLSLSRTSSPNLFHLFAGLSKGKLVIFDVNLIKKVNGNILPSSLAPRHTLDSEKLGVSGRLQVAAELMYLSGDRLKFAVGDDCSDQAICTSVDVEEMTLKIASQDRAGFSKIGLSNGILIGASTNGTLYASMKTGEMKELNLCHCGISALSIFSASHPEKARFVYAALGDEAGSVHLVTLFCDAKEGLQIEHVNTLAAIHASTVTDVLLYSIDPIRMMSVSLDCRLVVAELQNDKLIEIDCVETRVQDPCGIAMIEATKKSYRVIVYGHGIETISNNLKTLGAEKC